MNHKYNYVFGSSILEIMLVISISSIGVYSMFTLFLKSITNINTNNQYLHASYAVQDMANRILANPIIAKTTNAYTISSFSIDSGDCKENIDVSYCENQMCSAIGIANYDIAFWKQMLACRLDNATAEIKIIEADMITKYEIAIEFNSINKKSNEDTKKFKISTYQTL